MRIIDAIWFTPSSGETIGVILALDDVTGEPKAYIGIGSGMDEELDVKIIKENGAKILPSTAQAIFEHFKNEKK